MPEAMDFTMAESMAVDAAPPPPPPRNPARLSRIKTTVSEAVTQQITQELVPEVMQEEALSNELTDLWEHAALLYHQFEWQESAETFLYLSRVIERDMDSTLCLLNAAMVFARLGDYSTASQVLDESSHIEDTLALTLFIMGHVEFQLAHFEKAEDCLRVSLSVMNQPRLKYHQYGFNFTLWATQIDDDLQAFRSNSATNAVLSSFPADGVFEAPSRSPQWSLKPRDSLESGRLPTLSEGSSSPVESPIDSIKSLEYTNGDVHWHASQEDPDVQMSELLRHGKSPVVTILGDDAPELPQRRFSNAKRLGNSLVRRVSKRQSDVRPLEPTPKRRPAMEARNARVKDDSVQELSGYIRDLPSQNRLNPRHAATEHGDTGGLSDFIKAGPQIAASGQPVVKPVSQRSGSEISQASDDLSADSMVSGDLTQDWDSVRTDSGPPTPSQFRYRSGLGSLLSADDINERPHLSRSSSSYTSQPAEEKHDYFSNSLHHQLSDSSSDIQSSDSWPLTDTASERLRVAALRPSVSRGNSGPSIPTRGSSLRYEASDSSIRTASPMSFSRNQDSRLSFREASPATSLRQESRQTVRQDSPAAPMRRLPAPTSAPRPISTAMLANITSLDGTESWTGTPGTPSIRSSAAPSVTTPCVKRTNSILAPSVLSSTCTSSSNSKRTKKSTFQFLNRLGNMGY